MSTTQGDKDMKPTALKILIYILLLTLSVCMIFTSCQGRADSDTDGYVVFEDSLGRRISIDEEPKRVAALLGSFADVWRLAGGELCAFAEDAVSDFGMSSEGVVIVGGAHSPSLELLLSANPDFVIASSTVAKDVEMLDTLEALGITVAYFDVKNFDDYLGMLDICTRITGRRDLYEQNGLAQKERIDAVKARFAEVVAQNERSILLLRTAASTLKAKGSSGTVLGEMLFDIGCANIADSDAGLLDQLSIEAIIKENPYHIFVVTMGSDTEAALASFYSMINENPAWQTLDAVKYGRVHIMDKALYNLKPNSRFAEAYEKLYEIFIEK